MSDAFDPTDMIARFAERATAVRERGMPPIEGPERAAWVARAKQDFMDYAMLADAEATLEDGILTLRVDLRPRDQS
jgi:limonene-1,2-epoxide hydrolase